MKKFIATLAATILLVAYLPISAIQAKAEDSYVYGYVKYLTNYEYYESEGVENKTEYDTISSATTSGKANNFYYTYVDVKEDKTMDIVGVSLNEISVEGEGKTAKTSKTNVGFPVRILKSTYDAYTANKANDAVKNILDRGFTKSENTLTTYKDINSDGTVGALVLPDENSKNITDAKVEVLTNSTWGEYQVNILGNDGKQYSDLPNGKAIVAGYITTTDNKKYGLIALDNIWYQSYEIGLAATRAYEVHGNKLEYKKFNGLVGSDIASVTYVYVSDTADITSVKSVTYTFAENAKFKSIVDSKTNSAVATDVVLGKDSQTTVSITTQKSGYTISSIGELKAGTDYTVKVDGENKMSVSFTDVNKLKAGEYKVTLSNPDYSDITTTFAVKYDVKDDAVTLKNNKITIDTDKFTLAEYISAVKTVLVNGKVVNGANGSTLINEDGTINVDAAVSMRGMTTELFKEDGEYTVELTAPGYPTVTGKVAKPYTEKPENDNSNNEVNTAPKTGDYNNAGMLMMILACSLIIMISIASMRKKENI